jgi:hypothetical protein
MAALEEFAGGFEVARIPGFAAAVKTPGRRPSLYIASEKTQFALSMDARPDDRHSPRLENPSESLKAERSLERY